MITPVFYRSTLVAGLVVGAVNYGLSRLVVGRRRAAARGADGDGRTPAVEATFSHDWSGCDPEKCALPVDSDDEIGMSAGAFNSLIRTLARSHVVEDATREFSAVLSREFELEGLGDAALEGLLRHTGAEAGAILVARDDRMEALASHGLRGIDGLAASDHVRRVLRVDRTEHLHVDAPDVIVDSLLVGQAAREILVAPVTFKSVPLGAIVLATPGAIRARCRPAPRAAPGRPRPGRKQRPRP